MVNYEIGSQRPQTYEEWLALSEEDRLAVKRSGNAYDREHIGFAYTAAGRFAIAANSKVHDVSIGTYHGGEYLLHMYVEDSEVASLPRMLELSFEGFRVVWLPVSQTRALRRTSA